MRISILALRKKKNSQSKIGRKQNGKKKSRSKIRRKQKKIYRKGLWTRQYLNNIKLSQANKKRKETMTGSGHLPLITNQNLVRRRIFCPALNKKNKKGKRPKHSEPNSPPKTLFLRKIPIDP